MLAKSLDAACVPAEVTAFVRSQRGQLAAAAPPPGVPAVVAARVHRALGDDFLAGFRWIIAVGAALAVLGSMTPALSV